MKSVYKWLLLMPVLFLIGCGDKEQSREEKPKKLCIATTQRFGKNYIVFKRGDEEITISFEKLKYLAKTPIPDKYCGEYYTLVDRGGYAYDGNYGPSWKRDMQLEWLKYKNSTINDKVDGYIKIDGTWVKKDRVIAYDDVPDKYQTLRDKIEKRVKREER